MALLTSDLHMVMKRDPAFLGVFALDKVPLIVKKGYVKFIINLDPATKPGSHWVAIWRKGNTGYYYDSFGLIPPPALEAWQIRNSDSWIYNSVLIQSPTGKTACGYLCISFLTNKFSI